MADNALKINTGTALDMASDDIAGVHYPRVKISVGADGAAADWAGTIGTVAVLENGTVRMASGTLTEVVLLTLVGEVETLNTIGTLPIGTVLPIGARHADEFATTVNSGTSTLGTIKAAVSGSAIYVTGLIVSVGSASNVEIASGGTSTPVIGTMFFNANGGVAAMPFDPPIRTASGSALVYKQSANGPLTITAVGYVD